METRRSQHLLSGNPSNRRYTPAPLKSDKIPGSMQSFASGLGKNPAWVTGGMSQKRDKGKETKSDSDSADPLDFLSCSEADWEDVDEVRQTSKKKAKEAGHDSSTSALTYRDGKYKNLKIMKKSKQILTATPVTSSMDASINTPKSYDLLENDQPTTSKRKPSSQDTIDLDEDRNPPAAGRHSHTNTNRPGKVQVAETGTAPKARPKPRPVKKRDAPGQGSTLPLTTQSHPRSPTLDRKKKTDFQSRSSTASLSRSDSPSFKTRRPAEFPMSDASSPPSSSPALPKQKLKDRASAYSMVKDETATKKRKPGTFPMEPALKQTSKANKERKAAAFPMQADICDEQLSPASSSGGGTKRSSGSPIYDQASKKRRSFGMRSSDDDEDTTFLSTETDPSTLCPFCDMPLPSTPSALLLRLLENTRSRARNDPRPTNPLGLNAPLTTYIAVCQRHRFENTILPQAEAKGWPKSIDWEKLERRVTAMERQLTTLIKLGYENENGSTYWKDVMKEVKEKGSRSVGGVGGQFASFEKTQPGYYGEQGSMIIHQALYALFPPSNFDATSIAPLTPNDFIQKVLVPEVAIRLIMEDQYDSDEVIETEHAKRILRESASYGAAMFPVDGADWDDADANNRSHENLLKIGAIRQTKLKQQVERIKEAIPKKGTASRSKTRKPSSYVEVEDRIESDSSAIGMDSTAEDSRSRPRPKPRVKRSKNVTDSSDVEMAVSHSTDSAASKKRMNKMSAKSQKARHIDETDDPDLEVVLDKPTQLHRALSAAPFPMDDMVSPALDDSTPKPTRLRNPPQRRKADLSSTGRATEDGWRRSMMIDTESGNDSDSSTSSFDVPKPPVHIKRSSSVANHRRVKKEDYSWLIGSDDSQIR